MEGMKVFNYNDTPITFDTAAATGTMINATEMAKPFKKTTKDWLRTQQSKDFISSLSAVRQICPTGLVQIIQGGNDKKAQGTWMHEDVALEFARWLSPAFAIWCNDRIKELLLNGQTNLVRKKEKNVIPGTFFPRIETIGGNTVWTVEYKGDTLYRLKDIMVAIDLYRKSKSWTYRERPYVIRLYDSKGTRTSPYMDKNGVILFIESIREKKRGESWRKFKKDFTLYLRGENKKMIAPVETLDEQKEPVCKSWINDLIEKSRLTEENIVDFLNLIVGMSDDEKRKELYGIFKKYVGIK